MNRNHFLESWISTKYYFALKDREELRSLSDQVECLTWGDCLPDCSVHNQQWVQPDLSFHSYGTWNWFSKEESESRSLFLGRRTQLDSKDSWSITVSIVWKFQDQGSGKCAVCLTRLLFLTLRFRLWCFL